MKLDVINKNVCCRKDAWSKVPQLRFQNCVQMLSILRTSHLEAETFPAWSLPRVIFFPNAMQ